MTILNSITKNMSSTNLKETTALAFIKNFENTFEKYMTLPLPEVVDKKRRKKIVRFRKVSPYLAFCAAYRDSKRDSKGKLPTKIDGTSAVLQITREAGAEWKKLSEKERKPWQAKAEELTIAAKKVWDARVINESASPSAESIREMKKTELTKLVNKTSIVVPRKA